MPGLAIVILLLLNLVLGWNLYRRRAQERAQAQQAISLHSQLENLRNRLEQETDAHKSADVRLKAGEIRNRLISYSAGITVWEWDLVSDAMIWNENQIEFFGHPLSRMENSREWWLDNIHPEDSQRVMQSIKEYLILCDDVWHEEYRFRRYDGGWSSVSHWGMAIANEAGKPIRMVGAMMDITDRKLLEEQLKYQAVHDELTGLYNRRVMEQRLKGEVDRANRYDHSLSVFMLDIDYFKQINDTHGHSAGDSVLQAFASILEKTTRKTDYLARYGGEEFVVILPETSLETACTLAERLRDEIASQTISIDEHTSLTVTASIGIASFPEHTESPQELLGIADKAMYQAKQGGRNRVCFNPVVAKSY